MEDLLVIPYEQIKAELQRCAKELTEQHSPSTTWMIKLGVQDWLKEEQFLQKEVHYERRH